MWSLTSWCTHSSPVYWIPSKDVDGALDHEANPRNGMEISRLDKKMAIVGTASHLYERHLAIPVQLA